MSPTKPLDVAILTKIWDCGAKVPGKPYQEYAEKAKPATKYWSCYILAKETEVFCVRCTNTTKKLLAVRISVDACHVQQYILRPKGEAGDTVTCHGTGSHCMAFHLVSALTRVGSKRSRPPSETGCIGVTVYEPSGAGSGLPSPEGPTEQLELPVSMDGTFWKLCVRLTGSELMVGEPSPHAAEIGGMGWKRFASFNFNYRTEDELFSGRIRGINIPQKQGTPSDTDMVSFTGKRKRESMGDSAPRKRRDVPWADQSTHVRTVKTDNPAPSTSNRPERSRSPVIELMALSPKIPRDTGRTVEPDSPSSEGNSPASSKSKLKRGATMALSDKPAVTDPELPPFIPWPPDSPQAGPSASDNSPRKPASQFPRKSTNQPPPKPTNQPPPKPITKPPPKPIGQPPPKPTNQPPKPTSQPPPKPAKHPPPKPTNQPPPKPASQLLTESPPSNPPAVHAAEPVTEVVSPILNSIKSPPPQPQARPQHPVVTSTITPPPTPQGKPELEKSTAVSANEADRTATTLAAFLDEVSPFRPLGLSAKDLQEAKISTLAELKIIARKPEAFRTKIPALADLRERDEYLWMMFRKGLRKLVEGDHREQSADNLDPVRKFVRSLGGGEFIDSEALVDGLRGAGISSEKDLLVLSRNLGKYTENIPFLREFAASKVFGWTIFQVGLEGLPGQKTLTPVQAQGNGAGGEGRAYIKWFLDTIDPDKPLGHLADGFVKAGLTDRIPLLHVAEDIEIAMDSMPFLQGLASGDQLVWAMILIGLENLVKSA